MSIAERKVMKGMEQGREDIILQGVILLREIMVYLGVPDLIVSTKGVRYGVIYEKFRDKQQIN
jgi:exopolyphosphatase/guanosine-5'-triphosphate,3'-diphosphate pyrophosphatase